MVNKDRMEIIDKTLIEKIEALERQNQELQARLEEAQEALRAISTGEVDALVVYGEEGERIYTLQGSDYAYRVMVESIHEGAASIKPNGTILYSNKCLADMLKLPLEKVLGSSFQKYLPAAQKELFETLTFRGPASFAKTELNLITAQGAALPVLVTASAAEVDGSHGVCLVITDLTEQKQAAMRERELQILLMDQREEERVRIARNLHDGPLQDLISLSFTLEAMMMAHKDTHPSVNESLGGVRSGILKLAGDLRHVCNELRPISTVRFGLSKAIQYQCDEIKEKNPHLEIQLDLVENSQSIPKDMSTTLFQIFQESMNNIIRHAEATRVQVGLKISEDKVELEVQDNGKGFAPPQDWMVMARQGHLGVVGMLERVEALGGKVRINSAPAQGTTINIVVPNDTSQPVP